MTTTSRLDALRGQFGPHSIDTLLVSQLENRLYLSGFDGSSGFLLVSPRHAILATDFRYIEQAHQQAPLYTICKIQESWETWLPEVLSELNSRELGFEADGLSVSIYNQICKALLPEKSGVKLVPTSGLVETQRMVKDTAEIAAMREAIAISDAAMDHARQTIRCGMSEVEVAWSIEKYMREHGSQSVPFELIVASGPNSALPHAKPSKRPIQAGEPLVIDIGAQCHGYTSDLTRTLYLGQPNEMALCSRRSKKQCRKSEPEWKAVRLTACPEWSLPKPATGRPSGIAWGMEWAWQHTSCHASAPTILPSCKMV
jgi:Xaa-Pro aminopeptidase